MPEKPYQYDRCAELGYVAPAKQPEVTRDELDKLVERVLHLEMQLASFTSAKEAAKSPV